MLNKCLMTFDIDKEQFHIERKKNIQVFMAVPTRRGIMLEIGGKGPFDLLKNVRQ